MSFEMDTRWSVQLTSPDSGHIASVTTPSGSPTNSAARILGDHGLMIKYLNEHLVAVAVTDDRDLSMTLHLLDAVTGRTVHARRHERASGPIRVVVAGNWIVYSYFNAKVKRTEIASVALYDGTIDKKGLNGWSDPKCAPDCLSTTRSSLEETSTPIALTKEFSFPVGVRSLATTQTLHGISNVDVLFALRTGKIMSMSKRFLDPRRPVSDALSEADKREKLVKYHPNLPYMPQKVISYNLTVANVRSIISGPTRLESTSMVFSFGLDLFFARVTPSNAFDRLPDSFNTLAVGSLLVGLACGVAVLRHLIAKKGVDSAWK